jgi:hypothetical protein
MHGFGDAGSVTTPPGIRESMGTEWNERLREK